MFGQQNIWLFLVAAVSTLMFKIFFEVVFIFSAAPIGRCPYGLDGVLRMSMCIFLCFRCALSLFFQKCYHFWFLKEYINILTPSEQSFV